MNGRSDVRPELVELMAQILNEDIALQQLPDYYKHLLYIACSASFGIKAGKGAMGLIKKK